LPADTTRTPWGIVLFEAFGRGQRLEPSVVEAQARELLPWVVAHTRGVLEGEAAVRFGETRRITELAASI
jgi:hypothetical protein